MIPIWKDTTLVAGPSGKPYWTRIRKDSATGEVIFTGRTSEYDDAVRMNGVCADYLKTGLPMIDEADEFTAREPVTFVLQSSANGSAWVDKGSVEFYPNWSYDWEFTETARALTMGPSREVTLGQYLMVTAIWPDGAPASTALTLKGTRKDGTAYTYAIPVPEGSKMGTGVFTLSQFASVGDVLEVAGLTFRVTDACTRHVLYWFNDYGGWEQMLVRNGAPQADEVTRNTVQTGKKNTAGWFGTTRAIREYANATVRKMTLGTGWLSDEGSLQMRGLFNSTEILLFDTQAESEEARFIPVVLTGESMEYKTFMSNGGNLVRYDFEAQVALNFTRRCGQ